MWALPKKTVLMPVIWKIWVKTVLYCGPIKCKKMLLDFVYRPILLTSLLYIHRTDIYNNTNMKKNRQNKNYKQYTTFVADATASINLFIYSVYQSTA